MSRNTDSYYDTEISTTVKNKATNKSHRIRKIKQVPYVTYNRRTRVLFANPIGGAYINVEGKRVFFL